MKDAYKNSLSTTTEEKIFNTIPDHVFWDIKTPQKDSPLVRTNRFNPFRGRESANFFEMRDTEEFMDRQETKANLNDSISLHKRV